MNRAVRPSGSRHELDCPWIEVVSAAADAELGLLDREAALAHAARCPTCGAIAGVSIGPARPFGVGGPFAQDAMSRRERRWLNGKIARRLLIFLAVIIVAEAVPQYLVGDGFAAESHTLRHLTAWQVAFGVALFVAAKVSRMTSSMLAFATTFATLTITAKVIDLTVGHRGPWADPVHLIELAAVGLLWRIAPVHLSSAYVRWHATARADSTQGELAGMRPRD
jgi:hypothetical protein